MTDNSKNEEAKMTNNSPSREITADELDQVVGGTGVGRFGLRANGVEILQVVIGGLS